MDNIIHAFNFRRFLKHSRLIVVIDFRLIVAYNQGRWTINECDENESVNRAAIHFFRIHFFFIIYDSELGVSLSLFLSFSFTLINFFSHSLALPCAIRNSLRIFVSTIIRYSSCRSIELILSSIICSLLLFPPSPASNDSLDYCACSIFARTETIMRTC